MGFLSSTAALFTACAALVGGLTALLKAIVEFKKETDVNKLKSRKFVILAIVLLFFSLSLALSWSLGRRAEAAEFEKMANLSESLNGKLTREAEEAYVKNDYATSIAKASECIDEFEGTADRQQKELAEVKAPKPPIDKFTAEQKRETLARGPLNDVATSFFFVGRSAEKLGRLDEAKEAYRKAIRYTYARAWDPKGWFWSPADTAQDRLSRLEK